jgi:LacI family repressor for deo operon, udp, cdd, tsx, nupC, and nupG
VEGLSIDTVRVDNFRGEYEATSHLLRLGHRRIAHIAGPPVLHVAGERRRGYLEALRSAGLDAGAVIVEGDFTADGGRRAMEGVLRSHPAVTAVVAANDLMAIGAIEALRQFGRRVPEDVAVVGFDDITFASLVSPQLTTVAQPKYRMGQMAMERLLQLVHGADARSRQTVLVPELVVRESCGSRLGGREQSDGKEAVR